MTLIVTIDHHPSLPQPRTADLRRRHARTRFASLELADQHER
jgi:hypothetical protein